ncbi:MAG: hypothetical protein EBX70_03555 [Betaproteobacteria bacterium]|nr:hypothetical protein [Betaproteobacteria bacterium]
MIDWPYPRIIAHRGAGKLAPENTLAAMQVALQHRQKMVEFDVKLSADDVAVLMHDANLDRTTNGIGPIRQFNWAELARLDAGSWHSEAFAGEPIPRLDSALAWLLGQVASFSERLTKIEGQMPALITPEGVPTDSPISAERRQRMKEELLDKIYDLQMRVKLLEQKEKDK